MFMDGRIFSGAWNDPSRRAPIANARAAEIRATKGGVEDKEDD
jgi:hypothetical protein